MQVVPIQLIAPQSITDTLAAYYTAPGNKKVLVTKLTMTNVGTTAEKVDLHLVPSGGTADATNKVIAAKTLNGESAEALYQLEGQVLPAGTEIHAKTDASASTNIVIAASGAEIV